MAGKGATELSLEDRVQIEKFLRLGYKIGGIAQILGRSPSGIKKEIERNGHKSEYSAQKAHEAAIQRKNAGNRSKQKSLTDQEVQQIMHLINERKSIHSIVDETGISRHRLVGFMKSKQLKSIPMHYTGFNMRIEALEAQMEIALEKIKELCEQN